MTGGRGATVPDRGRQSGVARTRLARQPPRGFWLGVARALAPDPVLALLVARRGDAPRLRPGRGAAVSAPPVGRPPLPAAAPSTATPAATAPARAVPATPAEVTAAPAIAASGGPSTAGSPAAPPDTDERGCVTDPFRPAVSHLADRCGGGWRSPGAECPDRPTSRERGTPARPTAAGPGRKRRRGERGRRGLRPGAGGLAAPPRPLPPPFLRRAGDVVGAELQRLEESSGSVRDVQTTVANGCAGNDFVWTRYRWQGSAYGVADQATCELCADPGLDLGARGNIPTRASGARPSSGAPRARSSAPRGRR